MTKIDLNKSAMANCPRFERCDINSCTLANNPQLVNLPDDYAIIHKEKCASKKKRLAIGLAFKLSNKGLTPRELSHYSRSNLFLTRANQVETPNSALAGEDSIGKVGVGK